MQGVLFVKSINEVDGYIHNGAKSADWYNSNKMLLGRTYIAKQLEIVGTIDGREVRFKSPNVMFTKTDGFLNHIVIHDKTGWFDVIDGKQTAHYGHPMFDGGTLPNVAIDSHSEIVRLVNEGDMLNISYCIKHKNTLLPFDTIWRVKILK